MRPRSLALGDQPRGKELTFTAMLVDAGTNQVFGDVEIPFRVK